MQEHIRRAHPNYYIPKLPATEESFQLMINTPPSQRPQLPPAAPPSRRGPCTFDVAGGGQENIAKVMQQMSVTMTHT